MKTNRKKYSASKKVSIVRELLEVRDDVVSWVRYWSDRVSMRRGNLIRSVGISASKFYDWSFHYGEVRLKERAFNGWWGITAEEDAAIVTYRRSHEFEGYRRLCYQMLDENIVAVSPATVYRVLKRHNLLSRWHEVKESSKGRGFAQPSRAHRRWHVDISYVKIQYTFYFLISVLDGFSRYIVHSELRVHMEEFDVEVVVQRALEKYPGVKPRIISDNGSQFISRDFKRFLRDKELTHARTSVRYPQSNGNEKKNYGGQKKKGNKKPLKTGMKVSIMLLQSQSKKIAYGNRRFFQFRLNQYIHHRVRTPAQSPGPGSRRYPIYS
jgi:transposase InsO family protein